MRVKFKIFILVSLILFSLASIVIAAPISSCGNVGAGTWELDQNLNVQGTCFTITADNVVLDLNGYAVIGNTSGFGVYVGGSYDNIEIKNGTLSNFSYGIWLRSDDNQVEKTTIRNSGTGIRVDGRRNSISNASISFMSTVGISILDDLNTVKDSEIKNSYTGISLRGEDNTILNVQAINNDDAGIKLVGWNATIKDSNMSGNRFDFYISGFYTGAEWIMINQLNHTIENNIIGYSRKLYYNKTISDYTYDSSTNAGMIICLSCDNITVKNLNLNNNSNGAIFFKTTNIKMENVNLDDNDGNGVYIYKGRNNTLKDISANRLITAGIWLRDSLNNTLKNIVANNYRYSSTTYSFAILVENSSYNYFENINSSYVPDCGIYLSDYSQYNFFRNINVSHNGWAGITFENWNDFSNTTMINIEANNNSYYGIEPQEINKGYLNMINITANGNGNGGLAIQDCLDIQGGILRNIVTNYNGWDGGLWIPDSYNLIVENVVANNNAGTGIEMTYVQNSTFLDITANNNFGLGFDIRGISMRYSRNNTFNNINTINNTDNSPADTSYGIFVERRSWNNLFTDVTSRDNEFGFYVDDDSRSNTMINNVFCDNIIDDAFCDPAVPQAAFTNNYCDSGAVCGGNCVSCVGGNIPPTTKITSPAKECNYTINPGTGLTNAIEFNQISTDPDNDLRALWTFGDSTDSGWLVNCLSSGNCNTTHQYNRFGVNTISLRVEEIGGDQYATDSTRVMVYREGMNVLAIIDEPPYNKTVEGRVVYINANRSKAVNCSFNSVDCEASAPGDCEEIVDCSDPGVSIYCYKMPGLGVNYDLIFDWTFDGVEKKTGNWSTGYSDYVEFFHAFSNVGTHNLKLNVGYGEL